MSAADNITAIDSSTFNRLTQNILKGKAQKLIHEHAVKDANIIAERQRDRSNFINKTVKSVGDGFDNISPSYKQGASVKQQEEVGQAGIQYDNMLSERMEQLKKNVNKQGFQTDIPVKQSNDGKNMAASNFLPKEILESFKKNEIDTEALNPNKSILDRIGATNGYKEVSGQSISEGKNKPSEVDYSLIKQIVESAVKKYAVALNKRMINESKNASENASELKAMKIGKKFSFIDEEGNIYEAKLKFIKNIREK